ncbi:3-phenylpropionate-dihydrodiol/cinnamic acid-dihydrodiol dehydrogenase [uncultured archaeon]|nr:3-phenylpropionate-dihydrodiol/cinnamic acid-dihydrodiol dehydrogenase [uncultured archaeon]
MPKNNTIALITGANKGLGLETARQLGLKGIKILLGSRSKKRGIQALELLKHDGIDAEIIILDVNKQNTINAAVSKVKHKFKKLDILINNAGISIQREIPSKTRMSELRKTMDTNFFGVFAVTNAFLPLLRKSKAGRIVNVSSGLGSLFKLSDPNWVGAKSRSTAYSISKVALNALTVLFAKELKDTQIKINSINPGSTATSLNQFRGIKKPVESVKIIVYYATLPKDGPTGGFFSELGKEPW